MVVHVIALYAYLSSSVVSCNKTRSVKSTFVIGSRSRDAPHVAAFTTTSLIHIIELCLFNKRFTPVHESPTINHSHDTVQLIEITFTLLRNSLPSNNSHFDNRNRLS